MPLTMVRSATMMENASVSPRRMKRKASVTMNDGSPVRTTSWPFTKPSTSAQARETTIDSQTGQPKWSGGMAATMPVNPIIEPMERSNSPAIMSRHAPTARMPR